MKKGIYLVRLNCITVLLCFSFEVDVGHGHSFEKEMEVRILSCVYLPQAMDQFKRIRRFRQFLPCIGSLNGKTLFSGSEKSIAYFK